MINDMDEKSSKIKRPSDFESISTEGVMREISVVFRFILKSKKKRSEYLARLDQQSYIPFKVD
jgi:hypothetical protein